MKILFADTVHPFLEEELLRNGFETVHFTGTSREELRDLAAEAEGLVIRSKVKLDKEMLSYFPRLKFIARAGAGMENIDVKYAESIGIVCINSPEGNRDAVGEQAIGMLLMLLNNLKRADAEVRAGVWKREANRGREIMGKTVGIIGFGNTGSRFARKLGGFDCKILAYDKYKQGFGNEFVKEAGMEEIFAEADILSLHIPLTEETHYLFNTEYIGRFQKPFYFINTSRGKCVKTEDLVEGLKSGKILGACLDVLEYESISFESIEKDSYPEAFRYLISEERVVLAPHIAGWTHESNFKMAKTLAEKILFHFPPSKA